MMKMTILTPQVPRTIKMLVGSGQANVPLSDFTAEQLATMAEDWKRDLLAERERQVAEKAAKAVDAQARGGRQ